MKRRIQNYPEDFVKIIVNSWFESHWVSSQFKCLTRFWIRSWLCFSYLRHAKWCKTNSSPIFLVGHGEKFNKEITNGNTDETLCAIWYYLHNLKKVKNTHKGNLLLIKVQAKICNFTESNFLPYVFFTFFKSCK